MKKFNTNNLTIRAKMTIWYSIFLFALMVIFTIIISMTVRNFMYKDAYNLLQTESTRIISSIKSERGKFETKKSDDFNTTNISYAIFYPDGEIYFDNTNWKDINSVQNSLNKITKVDIGRQDGLLLDTQIKDRDKIIGTLRVVMPTKQIEHSMEIIEIIFAVAVPFYIIVVVAGSLFIAGKSLKPITNVTTTAEQISKLDLTKRIENIQTNDEVGRLATTFNAMLDRLEDAFARERQFSSDASHELRTPLSVISLSTEEALNAEKTNEEYVETLSKISSESKKMNKIIKQLLTLTRGYDSQFIINKENFNLTEVVRDIVYEMKDVADKYGVNINYNQEENITISADHMLITQMLINLITNACKYGKIGGCVDVETKVIDNFASIKISDNGIGISEEDLQFIFKRFYRADKSHTGDGSGLGLSIVKWIVDAHDGTIEVESKLGFETCVEVKIPFQI